MTVVAIVHPDGFPTLLTDLIIGKSGTKSITPSRIGLVSGQGYEPAELMRKSLIFGNATVVIGFAGDVELIDDFVSFLPSQFEILARDGARPMRIIGDMVNRFNDDNNATSSDRHRLISAVGFCGAPWLCCTNRLMAGLPLFPDRLIPRPS